MFESLTLSNFQCHEKIKIELDKGITVLTSPSDTGKSAILRGLHWLTFNRPLGDDFITWNKERCRVSAIVDGKEVIRKKGKGINTYQIDGEKYAVPGTGVPDAVSNLLNLGPINFQHQIPDHDNPTSDPLFWFALSPGNVSKELNAIVNLGLLDDILANISFELRSVRAEINVVESRLATAKQREKELLPFEKANADLMRLEASQIEINQNASKIDSLTVLLKDVNSALFDIENAAKKAATLSMIIAWGDAAAKSKEQILSLELILLEIKRLEPLTATIIRKVDLKEIEKIGNNWLVTTEKITKLEHLLGIIDKAETERIESETKCTRAAMRIEELIEEECPLCGAQING